jgi:hypothetical protein
MRFPPADRAQPSGEPTEQQAAEPGSVPEPAKSPEAEQPEKPAPHPYL